MEENMNPSGNRWTVKCPCCGADIDIILAKHSPRPLTFGPRPLTTGHTDIIIESDEGHAEEGALTPAEQDHRIAVLKAYGLTDDDTEPKMLSASDDPVVRAIMEAGTLRQCNLFKQHVMAQFFRRVAKCSWDFNQHRIVYDRDKDGNLIIDGKGMNLPFYEYAWKVVCDKLYEQSKMWEHHDTRCFHEDNLIYNEALVLKMFDHYVLTLREDFKNLQVRKCKGRKYIRFKKAYRFFGCKKKEYKGTFLDELEEKVFKRIEDFRDNFIGKTPTELYGAVLIFRKRMLIPFTKWDAEPAKEFKDAYKMYGIYFTMQNMIRFHGCRIHTMVGIQSQKRSLELLDHYRDEHLDEAWWMMGLFKAFVKDNHFDIEPLAKRWAATNRRWI